MKYIIKFFAVLGFLVLIYGLFIIATNEQTDYKILACFSGGCGLVFFSFILASLYEPYETKDDLARRLAASLTGFVFSLVLFTIVLLIQ